MNNTTIIRAPRPSMRTRALLVARRESLLLRTIAFGTRLCSLERWLGLTLAALLSLGCATNTSHAGADAVRVDVLNGYCVRVLPLFDGSVMAYGPNANELSSPDPANAICAAWVSAGESVWVTHAAVDMEAWPADLAPMYCSCL